MCFFAGRGVETHGRVSLRGVGIAKSLLTVIKYYFRDKIEILYVIGMEWDLINNRSSCNNSIRNLKAVAQAFQARFQFAARIASMLLGSSSQSPKSGAGSIVLFPFVIEGLCLTGAVVTSTLLIFKLFNRKIIFSTSRISTASIVIRIVLRCLPFKIKGFSGFLAADFSCVE